MVKPVARRLAVEWLRDRFRVSVRRACEVLKLAESTYRYRSKLKDLEGLRERLLELAGRSAFQKAMCGGNSIRFLRSWRGFLKIEKNSPGSRSHLWMMLFRGSLLKRI